MIYTPRKYGRALRHDSGICIWSKVSPSFLIGHGVHGDDGCWPRTPVPARGDGCVDELDNMVHWNWTMRCRLCLGLILDVGRCRIMKTFGAPGGCSAEDRGELMETLVLKKSLNLMSKINVTLSSRWLSKISSRFDRTFGKFATNNKIYQQQNDDLHEFHGAL